MTQIHAIDAAATLWHDAEGGREGSTLLIMLHGLGSHEGDLFSMGPELPRNLTIASLRAPLEYGDGWAWFASGSQDSTDQTLINASAAGVLEWLDSLPEKFERIGVLGFSQGGAMSLQLARLAPERFDFLVQLSGFVAAGEHEGDARLRAMSPQIPTFFGRGTLDTVIGPAAVARTVPWMHEHLDTHEHTYRIPHSINAHELGDIVVFLAEHAPEVEARE
ncbi:alpha/beta hydrolase [Humidisolicoccus flavus]|uniref:alpha/beta hydrolase n=1 Tax=Humidisolicoccus flavus TaxID=3111414 RepID=UPI00324A061E